MSEGFKPKDVSCYVHHDVTLKNVWGAQRNHGDCWKCQEAKAAAGADSSADPQLVKREAFDAMTPKAQDNHIKAGGRVID